MNWRRAFLLNRLPIGEDAPCWPPLRIPSRSLRRTPRLPPHRLFLYASPGSLHRQADSAPLLHHVSGFMGRRMQVRSPFEGHVIAGGIGFRSHGFIRLGCRTSRVRLNAR